MNAVTTNQLPPHEELVDLNLRVRGDLSELTDPFRTLTDVETKSATLRSSELLNLFEQTNQEGEFCEALHAAAETSDALLLNPGAWTHYSWAIHDALEPFEVPFVEVHMSNVDEREEWRRHSVLSGLGGLRIVGKGFDGYREALGLLNERRP